jgi:hypothetical protein
MDTRILVLMLLGVSLLAFGCAAKNSGSPTLGAANQTVVPSNDTPADSGQVGAGSDEEIMDNGTVQDGADMDDNSGEVGTNASTSDKNLSDLADLFKVDTDKPLEGEGLDVESPDSNSS